MIWALFRDVHDYSSSTVTDAELGHIMTLQGFALFCEELEIGVVIDFGEELTYPKLLPIPSSFKHFWNGGRTSTTVAINGSLPFMTRNFVSRTYASFRAP